METGYVNMLITRITDLLSLVISMHWPAVFSSVQKLFLFKPDVAIPSSRHRACLTLPAFLAQIFSVTSKLSVMDHVDSVPSSCARLMQVLRTLWSHGMDNELMQTVYHAVIIAKLLYPSSASQQCLADVWKSLRRVQCLDFVLLTDLLQLLHNLLRICSAGDMLFNTSVKSQSPSI